MTTRRGLITGLAGLIVAPAVVRAESLMPVRSVPLVVHWREPVAYWHYVMAHDGMIMPALDRDGSHFRHRILATVEVPGGALKESGILRLTYRPGGISGYEVIRGERDEA